MTPHRWRVGDTLRTTYGKTGVVVSTTTFSVVLERCPGDRCVHSQTLIKERVNEEKKDSPTIEERWDEEGGVGVVDGRLVRPRQLSLFGEPEETSDRRRPARAPSRRGRRGRGRA